MLKRVLALVCTVILAVSLVACGDGGDSNAGSKKEETNDTLNIATGVDRGTLAPVWASDQPGFSIYDVLYTMDRTPVLATEWEMVDDTHMRLHIREGVKDSAGNPFKASDVVYSLNYATTDFVSAFYVPSLDFENTKAVDEYTVEIALLQPDVCQWNLLANVRMFTQAAMEASEDGMITTPVGTGPYKVTEYIPNSSIKMEANENYWGDAAYKYVNWYVITEQAQRAVALESGQVDFAIDVSASDFLRLQSDNRYQVKTYSAGSNYLLFFNCSENSIFKNQVLRQAICYAVDNNAVSQVVFSGLAPASISTYIPSASGIDMSWCDDYYSVNQEKAKELLQQAGIEPGTKLTIGCPSDKNNTAIAEVVQGVLMELEFDVEIVTYETATWDEVAADPANGIDIQVNSTACPDEYYGNLVRSRIIMNKATHYDNEELVALIGESLITMDETKQLEVNRRISDIIYEGCPYYNLVDGMALAAYKAELSGVDKMLEHDRKALHLNYLY